MGRSNNALIRILQSRVVLLVLLVLTGLSLARLADEVLRRREINREIGKLQAQIEGLRTEQDSLSTLIDYLNSDSYLEEEARKKLNLTKPGERVVVINELDGDTGTGTSSTENTIQLWWEHFFKEV